MEITILRDGEKTIVVIEKNFESTTYNFFNASLTEIAEFVKALTEGK